MLRVVLALLAALALLAGWSSDQDDMDTAAPVAPLTLGVGILARRRAPWNPNEIADELMHHHAPPPNHGRMAQDDELDSIYRLAKAGGHDTVDGVWVDSHHGALALLWPMKLGRGDDC